MTPAKSPNDGDGMTLEELIRVAEEAGIDPQAIRSAAERLDDISAEEPVPWWTGVRPYTEIARTVPGEASGDNWDEIVAELRTSFRGPTGEASQLGKSSEWYGGSELTATQFSMTPLDGRTRIKVRLTAWAVPLFAFGGTVFFGGVATFVTITKLLKSGVTQAPGITAALVVLLWLGALLMTRLVVGSWYQRKLRQMGEALDRAQRVLGISAASRIQADRVPIPSAQSLPEEAVRLELGASEP